MLDDRAWMEFQNLFQWTEQRMLQTASNCRWLTKHFWIIAAWSTRTCKSHSSLGRDDQVNMVSIKGGKRDLCEN